MGQVETWNDLAAALAIDSIRSTTRAGSGHPTSAMSSAHLLAVLFAKHLHYDFDNPRSLSNDRLILSKGHAAPALYAAYKAAGVIDDEELMSLRKFGSLLEGHPVPRLTWVDAATGSLGQGLPIGVGMALVAKRDGLGFRTWVLLGDSEMAEGSVWEAMGTASYYQLSSLIGILDMNRLGQRGTTQLEWNSNAYATRATAFGWHTIEIDGHDVEAIDRAYEEAVNASPQPTLIIARTIKGYGVEEIADKNGWHGKPLPRDLADEAINELGGGRGVRISVTKPDRILPAPPSVDRVEYLTAYVRPTYSEGVPTRQAYGDTLTALGAVRPEIVVLDGEVGNSTFANIFEAAFPDRFYEMFIAEQLMVGAAVGMAALGKTAFASSFAAFLTRAYDFIRMASISGVNLRLCGSHAGISIGQDGPSQMGLEDVAMMRAIHGSTVFCPSDARSTVRIVELMADLPGISYLRTMRGATPLLYDESEDFHVGGSKLVHGEDDDNAIATIVGSGIGVVEALAAANELAAANISVRVIDAYSIKPIDSTSIAKAAQQTGAIITVEDHHPEGGLAEAVLAGLAQEGITSTFTSLAVRNMPGSATPEELREQAGISSSAIVRTVRSLTKSR